MGLSRLGIDLAASERNDSYARCSAASLCSVSSPKCCSAITAINDVDKSVRRTSVTSAEPNGSV